MQSKCKAMQSNFIRLVFVLILSNCLIINKTVVSFRYAVFTIRMYYFFFTLFFRFLHIYATFLCVRGIIDYSNV